LAVKKYNKSSVGKKRNYFPNNLIVYLLNNMLMWMMLILKLTAEME